MGCPRGYPMAQYMLETALPLPYPMAYPWHTNSREFLTSGPPLVHQFQSIPYPMAHPMAYPSLGNFLALAHPWRGGEAVHRLGLGWAGWNQNLMECYLFLVTTMPPTRPGKCALDFCSYQCLVRSHLDQSCSQPYGFPIGFPIPTNQLF